MIRAIHEWCVDSHLTPHLLVAVNQQTRVPIAFVKEGEIVLNLNHSSTKDLHMDNEAIVFSARFSGVSQHIYVPMSAVKGIFARENGQGMFFEINTEDVSANNNAAADSKVESSKSATTPTKKKPTLTIVK